MNKNCSSNVDTVVSHRLLDNLYSLSNTMENFKSMNLNFIDLGFVKWNNEGSIDKLLSLCYLLEIKSEVLLDLQRLLSSVPMICNVLNDDELMCLKFINDFGVVQFIGEADADCFDKLLSFFKVIEFKCSVLFSHYIPMQLDYYHHFNKLFGTHNLYDLPRILEESIEKGKQEIEVYSKDLDDSDDGSLLRGKLVRSEGIAHRKCTKKICEANKTPWTKSKFEAAHKIVKRTRHLIRLAEVYKDYTILYRGRYFKDTSKDIQLPDVLANTKDTAAAKGKNNVYFVRLPEECAGYEHRCSGQYVKVYNGDVLEDADTEEALYPSKKGDIPMSIRRNRHNANIHPLGR